MNESQTGPTWLKATIQGSKPFWVKPHRLFLLDPAERYQQILQALRAGQTIYVQDQAMNVSVASLTKKHQQRIAHLKTFERQGFSLDSFRMDSALYYRGEQAYYSMQQRLEEGLLPVSSIGMDPYNVVILSGKDTLLDVFVPAFRASLNFRGCLNPDLLVDQEEYALTCF